MKKAVKFLSLAIAVTISVFIVVLLAVFLTFDINEYKDDIVQFVESNTGRDFNIEGDIHLAISLVPTVIIEKASLGNAPWGSRKSMAKIEQLKVVIDVVPLLSRQIQVDHIDLIRPDIYLETDAEGRGNWIMDFMAAEKEKPPEKKEIPPESGLQLPELHFDRIFIKGARLAFRDGRSGKTQELVVEKMELGVEGKAEPIQIDIKARYGGRPVRLSGTTGPLKDLLANTAFPVNVRIGYADLQLDIDGSMARPLEGKGLTMQLGLKTDSLAKLPHVPELPDIGPVSLKTAMKVESGSYTLESLAARIGTSDLAGSMVVNTAASKPRITAELRSKQLDVRPFEPDEIFTKKALPKYLFPSDPLPLQYLQYVNMELSLSVASLNSKHFPMNNADLKLKLRDGDLHIAPLTARFADGKLAASATMKDTGRDSIDLDLEVDIDGLLPAKIPRVGKIDYIRQGRTDIDLKARSTGGDIRGLMGSLNGNLVVSTGKGAIKNSSLEMAGADLLTQLFTMLNPLSKEEDVTEMDCIVVNFIAKDGIAVSDNGIAMETQRMTVVGGGVINLRTEAIDLGMRPHAREGLGLGAGQLAELVRLSGTLTRPETKADTVAAMKTAATVGAAVLTSGLSLLAGGLFERITADPHPCKTALEMKAVASEQSRGTGAHTRRNGAGSKEKTMSDKVKNMFQGGSN